MSFFGFGTGRRDGYKRYSVPFNRNQLREIFLKHDENKDGMITKEELKAAFDFLGSNGKDYRAFRSMMVADSDGNGYITLDELDGLLDYAETCKYAII